jgi:hypothetical protein
MGILAAGIVIFGLIVGSIIWLVRLHWKISQIEEKTREMKEDFRDYEKRLTEVESKLKAYNLAKSILDYIGDKK